MVELCAAVTEINHTYSPIHPQNFLEICL